MVTVKVAKLNCIHFVMENPDNGDNMEISTDYGFPRSG